MIYQRVANFKSYLASIGLRPREIDELAKSAEEEIRVEVENIVANAVNEAADMGAAINAKEFLSQIRLDTSSGYIQISTDSGKLDFSEPPFPMLPWLLRNAKTAKDGSQYKVIPVGADSLSKPDKFSIRDVSSGLGALSSSRAGVEGMAEEMARAFNNAAINIKKESPEPKSKDQIDFRVASSKQDPTQKWVKPGKDLDMTGVIMSINSSIIHQVDEVCSRILKKYEMEAQDGVGNA